MENIKKRVVITGGAGFIGSHTVDEFLANNYEVVVIDNLRTGSEKNLEHVLNKIEFIKGDIRDKDLLKTIFKPGDIVIHLAAFVSVPESVANPEESHDINVSGSNTVFITATEAGVSKIISASSAAVYGNPEYTPIDEKHPIQQLSPYGLHKHINEQYGRLYSELYSKKQKENKDQHLNKNETEDKNKSANKHSQSGSAYVFMRFFNVYGPRQSSEGGYATVIPVFVKKIKNNEPATIHGDGSMIRDFVYVKDIAKALFLASQVQLENNFEVFNIATGKPTRIIDVWNALCSVLQKNILPLHAQERPGDVSVSMAEVSKAKKLLNFEAKVGLKEGLESLL